MADFLANFYWAEVLLPEIRVILYTQSNVKQN